MFYRLSNFLDSALWFIFHYFKFLFRELVGLGNKPDPMGAYVSVTPIVSKRANGTPLTGGVVESIHDGDTLVLNTGHRKITIRLAGIDCPELDQPHGKESRELFKELSLKQYVSFFSCGHDEFQREVGVIYTKDDTCVNEELIARGAAWHFDKYAPHLQHYANLQLDASRNKIGLWKEEDPISPWDWRKNHSRKPKF